MMSSDEFNENHQRENSEPKLHENSSDHSDVTNRLINLSINKPTAEAIEKKPQPISSKSRPLVVDDDDLDLDLELDENIDTSVSRLLIYFIVKIYF